MTINHVRRHKGRAKINQPKNNRRNESRVVAKPYRLKQHRRIESNDINASDLLKKRHGNGPDNKLRPVLPLKYGHKWLLVALAISLSLTSWASSASICSLPRILMRDFLAWSSLLRCTKLVGESEMKRAPVVMMVAGTMARRSERRQPQLCFEVA
ncbi:hypothetical protein GBA52_000724 [Prunus armeniaca]|nr:hypothetical protein GBA52_000724 [Prunus armeniaca]